MKLLVFRPELGEGGADRVTVTLLRYLDRTRFQPTLVLVRARGALLDQVPADVPVVDLGARRLAVAVPALARAVRRLAPDVIFSTSSGGNPVAVVARALARSRARLVLSQRSTLTRAAWSRSRIAMELPLKRLTYRRADLVTAVSDGVARELVERLALPREMVRTVYNPVIANDCEALAGERVDHPWFVDASAAAIPVFVACGRLVEVKDYPTLLDAFAQIRAAREARLVILGDGPLRGEVEARVRRLGLERDVALVGFAPNPLKYMARAYALLHASRVEGLPGALIQSLAVGAPVIATDCDHGPREVVRSGRDGFLVPVGAADALARRALELLADRAARDAMATEARVGARRFYVDTSVPRYERALAGEPELAA